MPSAPLTSLKSLCTTRRSLSDDGLDVVRGVADQYRGAFAQQLLRDSLVLLGSPLSGRNIEALWLAGTFREFGLERLGIDSRVRLSQIADIYTENTHGKSALRTVAVPRPACRAAPRSPALEPVELDGRGLEQTQPNPGRPPDRPALARHSAQASSAEDSPT